MFAKPQSEHEWLDQLLGKWKSESACAVPDEPNQITMGRAECRTLNGMWLIIEGETDSPGESCGRTMMTLGFDPGRKKYVGTFVGSMMTHLWQYEGSVDESGGRLVLDVEGPAFDGKGMANYKDSIEIVNKDHWILASQLLGDDGKWTQFMKVDHRRVG